MNIKLIGLVAVLMSASEALASDAYVKADEEFGQGLFRARGAECYFITAGHVVNEAAEIELVASNRQHFTANVVTSFPDDVAILRVNLPKGVSCQKGGWGAGEKLRALLSLEQTGVVKTRLSDGSTLQTVVDIKTYDNIRYIQVKPKDASTQFAKGFSGSTLFIAGEPAGMLQSVSNGVGKVFRQDALNNTVALFFRSGKTNTAQPADEGGTKAATIDKPASQVSVSPSVFTGKVAKDQVITHPFNAHENSPLIISGAALAKGVRYKLEVIDKQKKVLLKHYDTRGRAFDLPFTPPKDGTYTLKLSGIKHFGDYSLSLKQFTSAEALTGKANVLGLDQSVEGVLANQAVAKYRFKGNKNSPLIISGAAAGKGLRFKLEVINGQKKVLLSHYDTRGRAFDLPFTPPKDGTYTLKLHGIKHFGDYSLSLKQFTTAEALTGKANVLGLDESVEGVLANQAIAKYRFKGNKNSPLLISGAAAGAGMRFKLEVLDKRKKVLLSHYDTRGRAFDLPFTPPKDGNYTLKLHGVKHFGDYSLSLSQLASAEELTGKANVMQLDQTVEGVIAYQAIAEYKFKGKKNSALVISGAVAEKGVRYKLEVLDKRNKVLLSHYDTRGRAFDKPFTPPKDGNYTLKLIGIKHFGDYSLTIGKP